MNNPELENELLAMPDYNGIILTDVLEMPAPFNEIIRKMIRQGSMSLAEFAMDLGESQDTAQKIAEILVQKGILISGERTENSHVVLHVYLARLRGRSISADL